MSIRYLAASLVLTTHLAHAETTVVNGNTVDYFLSGKDDSRTVVYVPGCSGKDQLGLLYQALHLQKIKEQFNGDVNVVMIQIVDDATKGAQDGACFWDFETQNQRVGSLSAARKVADVIPWIKQQKWFSGNAHFFGFSQGGRYGLFVASIARTKDFFKSANLIWPNCLPAYAPPTTLKAHTPIRIYATENDPLSQPKNCPTFFSSDSDVELKLFPGEIHSWATHPSITKHSRYWANYRKNVVQQYVPEYAEQMWASWATWARCLEVSTSCRQK